MKSVVDSNNNSGGTLSYVKSFEIIHPELSFTLTTVSTLPRIVFTPVSTSEEWVASQRKQQTHSVYAYLMLMYHQRESSIIGDPSRPDGHGKGILDFANDFLTVFRGHRLSIDDVNYLDKPLDISNVDYIVETLGENAHLLIAQISITATKLILQDTLPGNV